VPECGIELDGDLIDGDASAQAQKINEVELGMDVLDGHGIDADAAVSTIRHRPVADRAVDAEATQVTVEGLHDLGAAPFLMKSDLNLSAGHVPLLNCVARVLHWKLVTTYIDPNFLVHMKNCSKSYPNFFSIKGIY
jgi:hypothetical protein